MSLFNYERLDGLSDSELEGLATKQKIRGYGNRSGSIDREIIINALTKRQSQKSNRLAIIISLIAVIVSTLSFVFSISTAFSRISTANNVDSAILPTNENVTPTAEVNKQAENSELTNCLATAFSKYSNGWTDDCIRMKTQNTCDFSNNAMPYGFRYDAYQNEKNDCFILFKK